jgi:hypothetical protein
MNRIIDDMLREMPWEEIIQAEMPAFQKHLTKGDVDSIVAFYSSPSGTKTLEGNAGNHGRVHAVDDADYPAVCRKNEHPRSGGNG